MGDPIPPPLPTSLITLEQLRVFKSYPSGEDALLTQLIGVAQNMIQDYCGQTFLPTARVETIGDWEGKTLVLLSYPVREVVLKDGASVIDPGLYSVFGSNGIVKFKLSQTVENLIAEYDSGFLTIPKDLQFATFLLVDTLRQKTKIGDVKSASFGGGGPAVTYTPDWAMPMTVKQILDTKYRTMRGF